MSELIAAGFKDRYRAAQVLSDLQRRGLKCAPELERAVVLSQLDYNEFRVQVCLNLNTEEENAWVKLWASFISLTLFIKSIESMSEAAKEFVVTAYGEPSTGFTTRSARPGVRWWREDLNICSEFIRDVGAMIEPGDSALLMLVPTNYSGELLRELRDYGAMPMHTTLSAEQDRKLKDAFALTKELE